MPLEPSRLCHSDVFVHCSRVTKRLKETSGNIIVAFLTRPLRNAVQNVGSETVAKLKEIFPE